MRLKPSAHPPDEMVNKLFCVSHTHTGCEGLFGMLCVNRLFRILNFNTVSSGIFFKSLYLSASPLDRQY